MPGKSTSPPTLSEDQAHQAQRLLAAMSLAVEHIAMTEDPDDLESLWMAYVTNQKSLDEILPEVWEAGHGQVSYGS